MRFACEKDMNLEGARWWTITSSVLSFQNFYVEILVQKYLRMCPS